MKYLKGKRMRLGLCLGLIATFIIGMASWAQTTMVADAPTVATPPPQSRPPPTPTPTPTPVASRPESTSR